MNYLNIDNLRVRKQFWIGVSVLILSAALLFARIGHYALWNDEAATALHAQGVWNTGDTTAVVGHNIIATANGVNLRDMHERLEPPLQSYLAAPFVGVLGSTAFAARLPFALIGIGCIGLLLYWVRDHYRETWKYVLFGIGILGNVSLFLYFRQSRYYAIAIAITMVLTYIYLNWSGRRLSLFLFSLISVGLYAANYLNFLAFYVVVFCDYVIWGRYRKKLSPIDWLVIVIPQSAAILVVASIWNPLGMDSNHSLPFTNISERLTLLWWNCRDLVRCEFGVGLILICAPFVGWWGGNKLLLRGCMAGLLYIIVICALSPQPVKFTSIADVRYLVPLIPLCIFLSVETIATLFRAHPAMALVVAALAFGSNLFGTGFFEGHKSRVFSFVCELINPPSDPYSITFKWMKRNVGKMESVWVVPEYMAYPLMFHNPDPIYAWQLEYPAKPQFKNLSAINFQGIIPPDYIIAFGPMVQQIPPLLNQWSGQGIRYVRIATLDHFWKDLYRPELLWRSSVALTDYDKELEAIYVFRRLDPPPGTKFPSKLQ